MEEVGSAAIIEAISTDINGIGYSGMGYKDSGVKIVPLSMNENMPYVTASAKSAVSGEYPLARFLYIYINKKPDQALSDLEKEFIKFLLSSEGQQLVIKDGYIALPDKVITKILNDIDA